MSCKKIRKVVTAVVFLAVFLALGSLYMSTARAGTIKDLDLVNSALSWEGNANYSRLCLQWVHDALVRTGAFDGNYPASRNVYSAQTYWNSLVSAGTAHPSAGNPADIPLGADVFFSSPPGYGDVGHIGIYIGGGQFISAVNNVEVHSFWDDGGQYGNYWGNSYYGWAWHDGITVIHTFPIDEAHFPDPNFRNYISVNYDTDHDGRLSDPEVQAVTTIYCEEDSISSLAGLEYFSAVENLYCNSNNLTTLDISKNQALKYLDCFDNRLLKLDVSQNKALKYLDCSFNRISSVKLCSDGFLKTLLCTDNRLKTLKLSKSIEYLDCSRNGISKLDVSQCPGLNSVVKKESRQSGDEFDCFGLHIDEDGEYAYYNMVFDSKVTVTAGPIVSHHSYTDYTYRNVIYRVKKNEASAIGTDNKDIKALMISDGFRLQGKQYRVTAIAKDAFKKLQKLTEVTIGNNVEEISFKAFYGCKKLKKVTVNDPSLKEIAGNAFKGINGKAVFYCPEKGFSRYKKLIRKSGAPSTVTCKKIK